MKGTWIWISDPRYQLSNYNGFSEAEKPYCMAEFRRTYVFSKKVVRVDLRTSGDSRFRLFLNDDFIYGGPPAVGGDFEPGERPFGRYFAQKLSIEPFSDTLTFCAQVQQQPVRLTDMSRGRGGFFLEGTVCFEDGSSTEISTDSTWQARKNNTFVEPFIYDERQENGAWEQAMTLVDLWQAEDAPIPPLSYTKILPTENGTVRVEAGECVETVVQFDKIYAAHLCIKHNADCEVQIETMERPDKKTGEESLFLCGKGEYRGFGMHSVGELHVRVKNPGKTAVTVDFSVWFVCYPVTQCGDFVCDDEKLNLVYNVCRHTLKICRQSLHLDSPMHQELMACTGDYYIESLMTAMTFGDLRLSEFDISRTADILRMKQGAMFHTTYSMIYVQMIYDIYMYTGNKALISEVWDAIDLLMERMHSYIREDGLIHNPPSYMFFDWMVRDGYSMHHPPQVMGQTLLCAFYHGALKTAVRLANLMDDGEKAERYEKRADALRKAMREKLYDEEKQMFFDGLEGESDSNYWMPENTTGRYFSKHSNILCALYDVCTEEEGRALVERVLFDDTLLCMQPYFMHFALEAVHKTGLFPKYGIRLLNRWKPIVEACDKGLQEGWFKPEETYAFDYSHAWGGTPAYQLPHKLLGLSVVEPGFRKIRLNPCLYGLSWAEISIPTPFGMLHCKMHGDKTELTIPDGIEVVQ